MPLTRKYTEAMERLAKAKTRLADADEKFYAALLDHLSTEDRNPLKATPPQTNPSKGSVPKSPPKK